MPDAPKKTQSPFESWTLQQLEDRIKKMMGAAVGSEENQLFIDGDHWQSGAAWVGPQPLTGDNSTQVTMAILSKIFTSRNAIREVCKRHTLGVVGVEPSFALVPKRPMKKDEKPTTAEQTLIDEAEALVTAFWNERRIHALIQELLFICLHQSRSVIRIFIPRGLFETKKVAGATVATIPKLPIDQLLRLIYIEATPVKSSAVIADKSTMLELGVFLTHEETESGEQGQQLMELCFVANPLEERSKQLTVLRTQKGEEKFDAQLQIGGRLTMYQLDHEMLISEQIRQQQKALNLALTCITQGLTDSNWLERTLLNTEPPGDWEYDSQTGAAIPGTFTPRPYVTGHGITNFPRGIEITKQTVSGEESDLTTPQLVYRPPTPIDPSIAGKNEHYQNILEEVDQAHVLLISEALPSGRSREQARADFKKRLQESQGIVEPTLSWLVETPLAMAEFFAGTPGKYTEQLRAQVRCRLDIGIPSTEERTSEITAMEKGLKARETVMENLNIIDVDAENARIAEDEHAQLDVKKKKIEIAQLAVGAGAALEGAAAYAGIEGDDLSDLLTEPTFEDEPVDENGDPATDPAVPPAEEPAPSAPELVA